MSRSAYGKAEALHQGVTRFDNTDVSFGDSRLSQKFTVFLLTLFLEKFMKLLKIAAAALALAVAGASHASIDDGSTGNGSMFMIGFDKKGGSTVAGIFDLGFTFNDLVGGTVVGPNAVANGSTVDPTALLENSTVVWDFLNNTVTVDGAVQNIGTNDWTAAFNTLVANADAADLQFVVGANDGTGFGLNKRFVVTGVETPTAQQLANSTGQAAGLGQIITPTNIFTPVANKGTIGTADNGAYTFTTADGAATRTNGYVMAGDGFANNWRNNNLLNGETDAGTLSYLWLIDGTAAERKLGSLASVDFNVAAGTLTYMGSAVPEPSSFVMTLAGLAAMGLFIRRRRA